MGGSSQKPAQRTFLEKLGRSEGFTFPSSLVTDCINLQGTLPAPPAYSGFCQQGKLSLHCFVLRRCILFRLLLIPAEHLELELLNPENGGVVLMEKYQILVLIPDLFSYNRFWQPQIWKMLMFLHSLLCPKKFHAGFWKQCVFPFFCLLFWKPENSLPKQHARVSDLQGNPGRPIRKKLQWGKCGWTQILTHYFVLQETNQSDLFSPKA